MNILRVLRERSTQAADVGTTTSPATHQLFINEHQELDKQQQIITTSCSCKHEETDEKTAAAELFPRTVRLTCMPPPDSTDENEVVITVLENPSGSWAAGNGSTLWDSAIALSGYLLKHKLPWLQGKRGLELGAGLGLVSMALHEAAVGIEMVATERPLMLALLRENCMFNSHSKNESIYYQYQQRTMQPRDNTTTGAHGVLEVPTAQSPVISSTIQSNIPVKPRHTTPMIHALTWGCNDDLQSIFRSISVPELLTPDIVVDDTTTDGHRSVSKTTIPIPQSRLLDFVVLADVIFPSNQDCWIDLADTLATVVSSCVSAPSSSSSSSSSSLTTTATTTTTTITTLFSTLSPSSSSSSSSSDDVLFNPPPPPLRPPPPAAPLLVGWLAYEPREDWVLIEFSSLLSDRQIHLHRVFDLDVIPEDIHVYELLYRITTS